MGVFDPVRRQQGDDFGGWLKKQIVGHMINDVFKSDLSERRFQQDLQNQNVSKAKDAIFSQNISMINNVELGNENYETYFDSFDENVKAIYDDQVKRYGNNPFMDSMYSVAMSVKDDELKKHENYFLRKDARTDIKNRVRGLRDEMKSDPFSVDLNVATSLFDEVSDFGEKNIGQVHQSQRDSWVKDMHSELDKTIQVAAAMNRLDTDTTTDGMQLSELMEKTIVDIGSGEEMSGRKAWDTASKFIQNGETNKGLAIINKILPYDVTLQKLEEAKHTKELTQMRTLLDDNYKGAASLFNNSLGTITAGMSTEKDNFDDHFTGVLKTVGILDMKIVNADNAGIDVFKEKTNALGRGIYSLFTELDIDKGGATRSGAESSYTEANVKARLLGTQEVVNGKQQFKPGILYKYFGFKRETINGKVVPENVEHNEKLRLDMDGTIQKGYMAMKEDIDADGIMSSGEAPNKEEAKRIMDTMVLYLKMNEEITGMELGEKLYQQKQRNRPQLQDKIAEGQKVLTQENEGAISSHEEGGTRTQEAYNNGNVNGTKGGQDATLIKSNPNAVGKEELTDTSTGRKFRNDLTSMPLEEMGLDSRVYAKPEILGDAITQYVNDVVAIRDFEQTSNLDEVYGLSAISAQYHDTGESREFTIGEEEAPWSSVVLAPNTIIPPKQVEKEGIRKGSMLSLEEKSRLGVQKALKEKRTLVATLKQREKEYIGMTKLYKPDIWYPTWNPNVGTFSKMQQGDEGYNEHLTSSAQEYVRAKEALKIHNTRVAKETKSLPLVGKGTDYPNLTAAGPELEGQGRYYAGLSEQEKIAYVDAQDKFKESYAQTPEVRTYQAKKKSLEDSRRILRTLVKNDEDFNDIMLTILDNQTDGQFSIQNGVIFMPGVDTNEDEQLVSSL